MSRFHATPPKFGRLNKMFMYTYYILLDLFQKNNFGHAYDDRYKTVTDKEKAVHK